MSHPDADKRRRHGMVLFPCSPASDMICGEIIMVDDGYAAL